MRIFRSLLAGMVAVIGSCSGSLKIPRSDAGRDATSAIDRPMDRPSNGGKGLDAQDGGEVCPPLDVATQCANNFDGCQPTWTDVLANPFCLFVQGLLFQTESRENCGGYHVRQVFWTADESSTYYYDIGTGILVAITPRESTPNRGVWADRQAASRSRDHALHCRLFACSTREC
jgi:hypothetical protein